MTVDELINALQKMQKDKTVVITDPGGVGWVEIGELINEDTCVKITNLKWEFNYYDDPS
jgi:hypothetical protein